MPWRVISTRRNGIKWGRVGHRFAVVDFERKLKDSCCRKTPFYESTLYSVMVLPMYKVTGAMPAADAHHRQMCGLIRETTMLCLLHKAGQQRQLLIQRMICQVSHPGS